MAKILTQRLTDQSVDGGDSIQHHREEPLVIVHPLHVGQLDIRMQHGVVGRGFLLGDRQAELPMGEPAVPVKRQPSVADGSLQWSNFHFALAADMVEGEQQVVLIPKPSRNLCFNFFIEIWVSVQKKRKRNRNIEWRS